MRALIESQVKIPNWAKTNPRLKRLYIHDRWLDGTIYDDLAYEFHQDTRPPNQFILMHKRKPAGRWRLPRAAASQIARKLFAGRHAPILTHQNPEVSKIMLALVREAKLISRMLQACQWGSVGSVLVTFKIAKDFNGVQRVATNVHRSRDCFPVFDLHQELKQVRIAYLVRGDWFLANGITTCVTDGSNARVVDENKIKANSDYWFIKDLTREAEIYYQPIRHYDWNPVDGKPDLVRKITEGELAPFEHELGFVPAQWFVNLSGGTFPDGACTFEDALDNVVEYDYTMSQIGLGVKNSACPHVVMQGAPVQQRDMNGQLIPWTPSRYLQFPGLRKDIEGITEGGGDAKLLEPTGQGMAVGIKDYARQLKKDGIESIAMSRKDPDKVTTAMSGKGLELIEEEFYDLNHELRTSYGDEGYLPLAKKIARAAIIVDHPLAKELNEKEIEDTTLAWPQIHDMSAGEYQQFSAALSQGTEAGFLDINEAAELHKAQVDMPLYTGPNKKRPEQPAAKSAPKKTKPKPKPTE